jgi:hypothetical protein
MSTDKVSNRLNIAKERITELENKQEENIRCSDVSSNLSYLRGGESHRRIAAQG